MSIKTEKVRTPAGTVSVYGGKHQGKYFAHVALDGNGTHALTACMTAGDGHEAIAVLRNLAHKAAVVADYIEEIMYQDAHVRELAVLSQEDE